MGGVFPSPVLVGGERQQASDDPDNFVGFSGFEKRTMAAVVENDKYPYQECSSQNRERQGNPPGYAQAEVHQAPEDRVRNHGVDDLPDAAPAIRPLILRQKLLP
jgi:hypothetical protein